jgi:CubicO group peptidase (beta-lactamase class C family)
VGFEEYGEITSLLVARGGQVGVEHYADGEPAALRNTRSCTKTVLGMLVGIAIERGIIAGVETTVGSLLPGRVPQLYPDPRKTEITVHDLLTMSSCLECDDWNEFSAGNEERMYLREDWAQFALDLPIRGDRGFSYCTAGVVLLGVAVEVALGESLASFAARELVPTANITDFDWPRTPLGQSHSAGGLAVTSRGLLGLGQLYLNAGDGVVSRAWVEESVTPHARIDEFTQYGYLWWLRDFAGHPCFYMTGTGGNRVHVFPDLDLVAVITTTNFRRRDAHELSDRLLVEQVLACLDSSLGGERLCGGNCLPIGRDQPDPHHERPDEEETEREERRRRHASDYTDEREPAHPGRQLHAAEHENEQREAEHDRACGEDDVPGYGEEVRHLRREAHIAAVADRERRRRMEGPTRDERAGAPHRERPEDPRPTLVADRIAQPGEQEQQADDAEQRHVQRHEDDRPVAALQIVRDVGRLVRPTWPAVDHRRDEHQDCERERTEARD